MIVTISVMILIHFLYSPGEGASGHDHTEEFLLGEVREIFPDCLSVRGDMGEDWAEVYGDSGILMGRVISTSPGADHIKGYAGATPLLVGIDLSGKIAGIQALESEETPAFVDSVISSGFFRGFEGIHWKEATDLEIDSVTGATMTSRAMARSIIYTLSIAEGTDVPPAKGYDKNDIFFIFLLVSALVVCLFPLRRHQFLRLLVLGISTLYLGFIRAEMLSLQVISGWVKNGPATSSGVILLLVAIVSLAVSFFKGKALYCRFICPFGGLQEFAGSLSPWNIRLSSGMFRLLRKFRYAFLALIALLLLAGMAKDLTVFEPFTVFAFRSAGITVLIIAGVSLFLSLFIGRPWCSFLCPTGAFLDIFKKENKPGCVFSRGEDIKEA